MYTFQSTRPSRASTPIKHGLLLFILFQSTRPSRASTEVRVLETAQKYISIHKALTGLDTFLKNTHNSLNISIHKALTGLDRI